MKIVISPAKTLDYETALPTDQYTLPRFQEEAKELNETLKKKSQKDISELMKLSDALASLNVQRYKDFSPSFSTDNARPAVFAFAGDVYTGLDAFSMSPKNIEVMQDKLRILSGMYGVLKPLDLLQPYRLEMGTKLPVGPHKNLYGYWKNIVAPAINEELKEGEILVNLASNEYFKAVDKKQLSAPVITPVFKDFKNGKLKVISFFAKKARGSMSRYLIDTNAQSLQDILSFNRDDYRYSAEHTVKENEPVFIR